MPEKDNQTALAETGRILRDLWNGSTKRLISAVNSDTTFIDSGIEGTLKGEEITAYLRNSDFGILKASVIEPRFTQVILDGHHILVEGTYKASSVPGSARRFEQRHQLTVLWEVKQNRLTICHYHASLMNGDEISQFREPSPAGTHEYTRVLERIRNDHALYTFNDREGVSYLLEAADILAVEADQNYVVVKRADNGPDISVRASFKAFMQQFPEGIFTGITRGVAVNYTYIESLGKGGVVTLTGGRQYVVSRMYIGSLRRRMKEDHENQ